MANNYFRSPENGSGFRRIEGSTSKVGGTLTRIEDFFRRATFPALVALTVIAGGLTGLVISYQASFSSFASEVESLAEYRPAEVTRVYADDGKTLIGELALERRIPLTYEEIPDLMKKAILAVEDQRFYQHIGIDPIRLAGSALNNLKFWRRAQGASTLTQQLARQLYLSNERTITRKVKEILYALEIERYYTKDQIMTLYCNQMFMGGGAYGIEAAANYYFSKKVKDLKLEEAALIAALFKSGSQYAPTSHPKAALERRNIVLGEMADAGFITRGEADAARKLPIKLDLNDSRGRNDQSPYAFFLEEVRQELQKIMESNALDALDVYRAGLTVYTTIDAKGQRDANQVVREYLRKFDRRKGWRGVKENILEKGNASAEVDSYRDPSWSYGTPHEGDILKGLIKEVNDRGTAVSFGGYSATITVKETEWTGRSPSKLFKKGDLAHFVVQSVDENNRTVNVLLEQIPDIRAGLVLIENKTGAVKAMFGGFDFATNKFNHATLAERQTGSVFKPFIYATAIEEGLRPDDQVDDTPFKRANWSPHNYDNRFMGRMPIKKALAQSRNIPAVRVLDEVGVNAAAQMVKRLGLPRQMVPYLSSALGATEETLISMTSAYTTFANSGIRVEPMRITKVQDRDGRVIFDGQPKSYKVIHPYVAGTMVEMMREVVRSGTAKAASGLGVEVAGKTGTVNDFTDAWFIGYTPTVACGVWLGYQDKTPLGKGMSGGTAALPFWLDFMRKYINGKPQGKFPSTPKPSDDILDKQDERKDERAKLMAKAAIGRGKSALPMGDGLPSIDPLAGGVEARPAEREPAPAPPPPQPEPPKQERPRVTAPKPPEPAAPEEPVKKGKKGNSGN